MKIVIHDLNRENWEKIATQYEGYEIIDDDGTIKPCVGCFGCWVKTPGECVINDRYKQIGATIMHSCEVIIITRCTFGGPSSFCKNVLDRSISAILPFFEMYKGEMHHKKRYKDAAPNIKFVFYGRDISEKEKDIAKTYVQALGDNLHAAGVDAVFTDELNPEKIDVVKADFNSNHSKTILLNGSLRGDKANSKALLDTIKENMSTEAEIINIGSYINKLDELAGVLLSARNIVFAMPLYVDGIPSSVLRIMEKMKNAEQSGNKNIYVVSNMGFYESHQMESLLAMMRCWSEEVGYTFGGAVAVGAGEMVGQLLLHIPADQGPCRNAGLALMQLAERIDKEEVMDVIYADAYKFPRFMYMIMAGKTWTKQIKGTSLTKKDLYRTIDL